MDHLSDAHLVAGQLNPSTFNGEERKAIADALTSGNAPDDASCSVAFALDHCAEMTDSEKASVAAVMVPAGPAPKKKVKKKKAAKKTKKG